MTVARAERLLVRVGVNPHTEFAVWTAGLSDCQYGHLFIHLVSHFSLPHLPPTTHHLPILCVLAPVLGQSFHYATATYGNNTPLFSPHVIFDIIPTSVSPLIPPAVGRMRPHNHADAVVVSKSRNWSPRGQPVSAQAQTLQHVIYEAGAHLLHYTIIVPWIQVHVNSSFQP